MRKVTKDDFKILEEQNLFSTGFTDVDEFLKKVDKGSIITIGARPAMGKTSFALSIVNHLLEQDKKIFYYSLSSKMVYITRRLVTNKFLITDSEFKKNPEKLEKAIKYYTKKELYINDKPNISADEIENEILSAEIKPDVVFIDYIQIVEMPKAPNYTDSINLVVKQLKKIAAETGVIFVILSQLSRSVEFKIDKRPVLSDIRSCSLLEEVSNVVMMIYRELYYNPDSDNNNAEIIFAKNDFSPTGVVSLRYEPRYGWFCNILRALSF